MDHQLKQHRPINLRIGANILSLITLMYTFPFFIKGYRKDLDVEDIPEVFESHRASKLGDKLDKLWQVEMTTKNPSMWRVLGRAFGSEFSYLGVGAFVDEMLRLLRPLALIELIKYFSQDDDRIRTINEAYMYGGIIAASTVVNAILNQLVHQHLPLLGMKIRVACTSLVYRKSLKLSKFALQNATVGQITNLVSNDINRVESSVQHVHYLWISPIALVITACILYTRLGLSSLVGLLFMVLLLPLQVWMGQQCSKIRLQTALKTDQRIRLMGEIISSMQVIKMYTWEKPFAKMVANIRRLEARHIRVRNNIQACMQFLAIAPKIAIFIAIGTYILTGNDLTAIYVFSVICFYENLKLCVTIYLTIAIGYFSEARISITRLKEFLLAQEVNSNTSPYHGLLEQQLLNKNENAFVALNEVSAKWNSNSSELTLNRITLRAETGQLVGIIGPVGCGKSSLLQTILNELPIEEGSISIHGKISYYPQEPWIFTGNIQQNILFGNSMEKKRYHEVIRICALKKDLEILPYGEQTEVGEKGVILSGGQKARISLARVIYNQADIYLLDDPFSAVDTHVGKHIFEQCIQEYLSQKCIILVTHQIQYLSKFNYIYLMETGRISANGTCEELKASQSKFLDQLSTASEDVATTETENTVSSESKEMKFPEVFKESRDTGGISNYVLMSYFKSGGSALMKSSMLIAFVVSHISYTASDYAIAYWVNEEQKKSEDDYQGLLSSSSCAYIYSGLVVFMILTSVIRLYMFFKFSTEVSVGIHDKMFNSVVKAPMHFFHTNYSGSVLNRFSKDMGTIDEAIPRSMIDCVEITFIAFGSIVLISITNPWMLVSATVIITLFYYIRDVYLKTSRDVRRLEGSARSPVYGHLIETLQGLSTIRASNSQSALHKKFDSLQDYHTSIWDLFVICSRTFSFYIDLICAVFIATITFGMLLNESERFAGSVALSITQGIGFLSMVQWGILQSCELENYMTSVERVTDYIKLKPEDGREGKQLASNWPQTGTIKFVSLSLKYNVGEPYVLKHLDFVIEAKQKIGIVGRTGAGKSTLLTALFQLVNSEGAILIDNEDISKIPLHTLRSKITIIPQDPVLFHGTIRSNLDPLNHYTDLDIWTAIEEVQLKNVIAELPLSLNHVVLDGGSNLSVGQRQLLCLGRAIIIKNKILVIDEATANVDPDTDTLIQNTIRRKFADCTVLTIAHRLNTIMDSDMTLVLDAGEVVEYDHPHLLLKNQHGIFYSMVHRTGPAMAMLLSKTAKDTSRLWGEEVIRRMLECYGWPGCEVLLERTKNKYKLQDFGTS